MFQPGTLYNLNPPLAAAFFAGARCKTGKAVVKVSQVRSDMRNATLCEFQSSWPALSPEKFQEGPRLCGRGIGNLACISKQKRCLVVVMCVVLCTVLMYLYRVLAFVLNHPSSDPIVIKRRDEP